MRLTPRTALPLLLAAAATLAPGSCSTTSNQMPLPGLQEQVRVVMDVDGVPHIFARNDVDLAYVQGFIHARDRLFQMDLTRRQVAGTESELLGPGSIFGDIQSRLFGLKRAAARSEAALTPREREILQAYTDGVNHYIALGVLPPEYAELELTSVEPWTVVDTLSIGKAIAASLSLDIDLGITDDLAAYVQAGIAQGFDGTALFFEDVRRTAPMSPASTIPDATGAKPFVVAKRTPDPVFLSQVAASARAVRERLSASPLLAEALDRRDTQKGSNEWGVAGEHTDTGRPIIANDPHLALDIPSTFYEVHLVVDDDPEAGPMNVSGVGFPGAPGVILGQNEDVSWGATTNPMDVTDLFWDTLAAPSVDCPAVACIVSEGELHPVELQTETFQTNRLDGVLDNIGSAGVVTLVRTVEFRSFGPILDERSQPDGSVKVLVAQYTGFHATREVQTFLTWNRARNLDDFRAGLRDFDFGSQNWIYTDREGNLAYFASAEMPLRRDLEQGTVYGGLSPEFIRDGSGPANWVSDPARSQGQAIPFAILPEDEMPHSVNPENGFVVNANNDPAGTSLDNDALNQFRVSNPQAIYYLSPGYSNGLRAGRITQLVTDAIAEGPVSFDDMQRFQANTQQLDAELMLPFLIEAWERGFEPGAPASLAALVADPRVDEAMERLADWDYSTPTGIPEGWDASDPAGERLPEVPEDEVAPSIAATLYNVWRGQLVRMVVDATLQRLGVPGVGSSDSLKGTYHLISREPFTGVGASGVDFFPEPAALTDAADRRDHTLLEALRRALDLLASDTFAVAYGNSTDQDDYRWGKLHRIRFDHPFEPAFSLPPQAGFQDVGPGLAGVARDGGYEVVNASGFSARANGPNDFDFGGGPVRRYVGTPDPGIQGVNVVPGGPSGVPGDPRYATQTATWLTSDYHEVDMRRDIPDDDPVVDDVTLFLPLP